MLSSTRGAALGAILLGGVLGSAPSALAAPQPYNCSASALGISLLGGSPVQPVSANAGGAQCQGATAALMPAPLGLPATLSAGAAAAQTALDGADGPPSAQAATATSSVSDLVVGGLSGLPLPVPGAPLPGGLNALPVPLSGALQSLGLPSSILVNVLPAAQALLPSRALPDLDLVDVHALSSTAAARCVAGAPALSGSSQVSGLSVLGQSLPVDQAVNQAVTLLNAQTVDLSSLDVGQVQLPAGLSFATPVVGPLLQSAVQSVVATLPPVQLPAELAQVQVTPAQQTSSGGTLTQRALRVQVSVLGQSVADLTLGQAQVSDAGVSCADPAPTAPASQLAVSCAGRPLTLISVYRKSGRVSLLGAAEQSLVGKTVGIVFSATGQQVTTAKVRPDGFFRASAPLPPEAIRGTNRARYQASYGGQSSLDLKLQRRMQLNVPHHRRGDILMSGRVVGPMTDPPRPIVLTRRVSCTHDLVVKRVVPNADGSWKALVPAPQGTQAAVYRATTEVLGLGGSGLFPTFTLPGYVSL
jgi:hypothetical protein